MADLHKQQKVAEIIKCAEDPTYFIRTYCKIRHPLKGLLSFDTYKFQDDCVEDFLEHRFNIILKSRQLGLSTITAGYALWLALFHREKSILTIATKLSTAVNFITKVKVMIDNLPPWLKIAKFEGSRQEVRLTNGSWIKAIPTSEDAGRSEALSLLIIDEFAFIRGIDEIWTAIWPTLSTGGNAIIISTPNGAAGLYYELWTNAEKKLNDFNTIKLPWTVHPEHDNEWFEKESRQLGSRRKVAQELLCEFVGSGQTFIDSENIMWLQGNVSTGYSCDPEYRDVWIWKQPVAGRRYLISADVARGNAKDGSTFHIFDADAFEVVAEFSGKMHPDIFADLLFKYGKLYNRALICPESNTYGFMTISKLINLGYKNIYYENAPKNSFENYKAKESDQPGFLTSLKTRPLILENMDQYIRNKKITTYSSRLIREFDTFVVADLKDGKTKVQALKGKHDDLIMCFAIGLWILENYYTKNKAGFMSLQEKCSLISTERTYFKENPNANAPALFTTSYLKKSATPADVQKTRDQNDLGWLLK
jgi:hypothetical protein